MKRTPLWYPYTQHKTAHEPICVKKAKGVYLYLENNEKLIDAISSWWCVIHGYNHPKLNIKAREQLAKMSHVMLGGLTHEPVQKLAQCLVDLTPEPLQHVFFSDSGSVGVEVALKMSIQYFQNQGIQKKKILAFKNGYHGDTTGAMSVSDPEEGMHHYFHSVLPQHFFLENPNNLTLEQLNNFFESHHHQLAACIIEPLLQAAGGFIMYPPTFLNHLRQLCNRYHVLLIYDEVATGFGRTGSLFATNKTDHSPDIMVLGKGLTGGYLGLAATLSTRKVFDAFYHDSNDKCFMHGPTFTGNPLACAIALESIQIFQNNHYLKKIMMIECILKENLLIFRHPKIKDIRVMGATGVIEVYKVSDLQGVQEFARKKGIWLRPFDRYLYTMPSYTISKYALKKIIFTMCSFFNKES